jgi:hypothetical protein
VVVVALAKSFPQPVFLAQGDKEIRHQKCAKERAKNPVAVEPERESRLDGRKPEVAPGT